MRISRSFYSENDAKREDCRRDDSVLHHIMEKAKLWGKKTDGGLPGAGRRLTSGWAQVGVMDAVKLESDGMHVSKHVGWNAKTNEL